MKMLSDIKGEFRLTPSRILRRVARDTVRIHRLLVMTVISQISKKVITDSTSELDISLTTHGERIRRVHLGIESIAQGEALPRSITLWLDADEYEGSRTSGLRRLESRGLTIKKSGGKFGPHTKYYPQVIEAYPNQRSVVTADDDIIYPKWWLSRLNECANTITENEILAYRAHRISLSREWLNPYNSWTQVQTTESSRFHFLTGVSGVFYPPKFLDLLAESGSDFLAYCPKADDVWLNVVALRNGFFVRQVESRPVNFLTILGTQSNRLQIGNVAGDGNDLQISSTYDETDFKRLSTGKQE